jgi:lipopolysaccharide export system ATP-binding protein
VTDPGILAHLRTRDPSLCLAVAALLRIADESGSAPFDALAVAYREDYLAVLRRVAGDEGRGDAGTLSVDDVRRHLAVSVLPRLATEALLTPPSRAWAAAEPVRLDPAVWEALRPEAEGHRLLLLETAYGGMLLHTTGEQPVPAAAAAERGSVLEGAGLTKTYSRRAVVQDVDVTVRQGEIVGLLGPNGAGKTTTFYMIVGLIAPQAGRILLDGEDISRMPMYQRARRGIGYLAQEPSVFRKLTVEENLMAVLETLPLGPRERVERLERLLDELSIRHVRHSKAYSLSGGERRRLEITRALVTQPKFMLLDEPFSGVDPIAVHDIQTIVAGLRHKGIGVLITDHNVEQTLDIVDRAYIMFEGRVQVSGTVRELVFDDRVAELYLGPTLTARLRSRLAAAA